MYVWVGLYVSMYTYERVSVEATRGRCAPWSWSYGLWATKHECCELNLVPPMLQALHFSALIWGFSCLPTNRDLFQHLSGRYPLPPTCTPRGKWVKWISSVLTLVQVVFPSQTKCLAWLLFPQGQLDLCLRGKKEQKLSTFKAKKKKGLPGPGFSYGVLVHKDGSQGQLNLTFSCMFTLYQK